jgi:hypothetical protein
MNIVRSASAVSAMLLVFVSSSFVRAETSCNANTVCSTGYSSATDSTRMRGDNREFSSRDRPNVCIGRFGHSASRLLVALATLQHQCVPTSPSSALLVEVK